MKNIIPRFKRPIRGIDEPKTAVEHWDTATDAFDEKNYKKAVTETINYMNPEVLANKDVSNDISFTRNQGSAEIIVTITSEKLQVKAPFLKVTDATNKIALFRKIAEVNFHPLTLAQIHLNENELWFEFETPLSLCQPYKVYDVLREICIYADDYDDEFVEKYKASFYKEPNVQELTSTEADAVMSQITNILDDYQSTSALFKEKRWNAFQWDIIVISLLKIANMPYVHGVLRTKIQEYVGNMFNGNIDFQYRIDKGTKFMNELCDKSREDILKDIYHADTFISLKYRSSTQIVQEEVKNWEATVTRYNKENDNFSMCYFLQYNFLYLLYNYNVEADIKNSIYDVLEIVSGLEPQDASPKLVSVYNSLLTGKPIVKKGKKGLFAKLFG